MKNLVELGKEHKEERKKSESLKNLPDNIEGIFVVQEVTKNVNLMRIRKMLHREITL